MGAQGEDLMLSPLARDLFPYSIECKNQAAINVWASDVGTKEKPSIIVRSHMVERKYKAWRDPDGSYHEQLIDADDVGDDIESYGGTS